MTSGDALSAGRRAARNTSARAAAEIVGKVATLLLFAMIARRLGESELGILVFGLAFLQISMTPVGLGMDPYLLRETAKERRAADDLFADMFTMKMVVALPLLALSVPVLAALGYGERTRVVVLLLGVSWILDILAKSAHAIFNARERGDLLGLTLVSQRILTAALGVGLLLGGAGLVPVAAIFAAGSALHLALSFVLLHRSGNRPAWHVHPARWRSVARRSSGFAVQDVLTVLLFKLDAVLLSLLVTQAAVGRYGAAYRVLESTLFIAWALSSGFAAMFAYLGPDTTPSVQTVFGQGLKVALMLTMPIAVVMGGLAEPIAVLLYGDGFRAVAEPLRLLAPVAVLLCVVTLATVLVLSRMSARSVAILTAIGVALNVGLNLVLIPAFEESGAAAAMLVTESAMAAGILVLAHRSVGGRVPWVRVLTSPLAAGAVMLVVVVALADLPIVAGVAGVATYALTVLAIERRFNPADLRFAAAILRRRTPVPAPPR